MVTAGVVVAVLLEETVMLAGMRLKSIGAFCCFEGVAIVVAKNSAFLLNVYFRVVGAAANSWRGGGECIIHIPSVPWIMAVSRKGAVITSGVCILPLVALVSAIAHYGGD
ncbi:putative integral membrane protein [Brugia pahangi]